MEEKKYYCQICGEELMVDEDEVYRDTYWDKKEGKMIYFEQSDLYCDNCGECVGKITESYYLMPKDVEVKFY